jgi:hypothetical protein
MQLYEALAQNVAAWREENYMHDDYPAIAEILEWARQPDAPVFRLRAPQLKALETYWYLRLAENTPHIFDLYQSLFPKKKDLLEAFGISDEAFACADYDIDSLVEGKYVVEAKKGASAAVKVTDMLGEEVLVVKEA